MRIPLLPRASARPPTLQAQLVGAQDRAAISAANVTLGPKHKGTNTCKAPSRPGAGGRDTAAWQTAKQSLSARVNPECPHVNSSASAKLHEGTWGAPRAGVASAFSYGRRASALP